jgi:hypothetical protein
MSTVVFTGGAERTEVVATALGATLAQREEGLLAERTRAFADSATDADVHDFAEQRALTDVVYRFNEQRRSWPRDAARALAHESAFTGARGAAAGPISVSAADADIRGLGAAQLRAVASTGTTLLCKATAGPQRGARGA